MPSDTPPIVLTFGLSDPTGGSGLQADLLTLASMGCHGLTVLTGYTVRDSATCDEVTGLDPDTVGTQARMLLEDMPVAAFKIGWEWDVFAFGAKPSAHLAKIDSALEHVGG